LPINHIQRISCRIIPRILTNNKASINVQSIVTHNGINIPNPCIYHFLNNVQHKHQNKSLYHVEYYDDIYELFYTSIYVMQYEIYNTKYHKKQYTNKIEAFNNLSDEIFNLYS
jgi:hypothetical protein